MKNWKVKSKLFASFGLMTLILIATILIAVFSLQSLNQQMGDFYAGAYTVRGIANGMKSNFEATQKYLYRAISNSDIVLTKDSVSLCEQRSQDLNALVPQLEALFDGDQKLLQSLKTSLSAAEPIRAKIAELALQLRNEQAITYMEEQYVPIAETTKETLNQVIAHVNSQGENTMQSIEAAQFRSIVLFVVAGVLALVIAVFLCLYITGMITRPLIELETVAGKMAQGDLKVNVHYHSNDELGSLAESMREMIATLSSYIADIGSGMSQLASGNLNVSPAVTFKGDFIALEQSLINVIMSFNDTFYQIARSADQVSTGSEQVSSGAQALSQGATEQASAVQQLAATITEISSQVKQNAQNAQSASQKVKSVGGELTQSNQSMHEMIQAMGEISNSSQQIGKIIKTIEDIAFQTNILALNAAVEAARAGAAGKGFAVVADEVRNLANKSQEASKNTSVLIEGSLRAVESGSRIADETAKSLMAVVEGTKEITAGIDQIAVASNQQAQSIVQVTQGVDQISAVVQTNSATAEESAAASQELSGQAQMLKNMVGKFKLRNQPGQDTPHFVAEERKSAYDSAPTGNSKY